MPWLPAGLVAMLALMTLGGGAYEVLVLDAAWPQRPELVQPQQGGVSRRRFWIPAHSAFELTLLVALVVTWGAPQVRTPLLVALSSHLAMRIWSFAEFIPKAVAFETAPAAMISRADALQWCRRGRLRLVLDLVTSVAALMAFAGACRLGA